MRFRLTPFHSFKSCMRRSPKHPSARINYICSNLLLLEMHKTNIESPMPHEMSRPPRCSVAALGSSLCRSGGFPVVCLVAPSRLPSSASSRLRRHRRIFQRHYFLRLIISYSTLHRAPLPPLAACGTAGSIACGGRKTCRPSRATCSCCLRCWRAGRPR